jgi:predicted glycosyltransferase
MAKTPRILLYSHDGYGLGHYRRCLSIGAAASARLPAAALLCVTGSPRAHSFALPANFDYVKLPAVTKDDAGHYASRTPGLCIEDVRRMRERILFEAAMHFAPDLVLVDHAPAGMEGELSRTLRQLRAERKGVRLILGLRDVVDSPEAVGRRWRRLGIPSLLDEVYDEVFVYGMRSVYDVTEAYGFPARLREKTRFVGYLYRNGALAPPEMVRCRLPMRTDRLVVATVGGGGDGHRVLGKLLEGIAERPPRRPYDLLVVTGPLMSERKHSRIEKLAADCPTPVRVARFLPDLLDHIRAADLVVGMAGYNSLCEVLALRRPAIVVPRVFPRREQAIRAERFAELGLVTMVHPSDLRGKALAESVEEALAAPPPSKRRGFRLDFGGLRRVADALERALLPRAACAAASNGSNHLHAATRTVLPPEPIR